MSVVSGTAATVDLPEPESIVERAGENPLRFLNMGEPDTALALIRGIDDLGRLEAWREAEEEFFNPPRDVILNALDAREAELRGEPVATDADEPADETSAPDPEPDPEPESTPAHAGVTDVLSKSEVLRIDRGTKTEYVWPAADGADKPYISQAIDDATGEVWMETGVSPKNVADRRRKNESEIVAADTVDVDAPDEAADFRGDSA